MINIVIKVDVSNVEETKKQFLKLNLHKKCLSTNKFYEEELYIHNFSLYYGIVNNWLGYFKIKFIEENLDKITVFDGCHPMNTVEKFIAYKKLGIVFDQDDVFPKKMFVSNDEIHWEIKRVLGNRPNGYYAFLNNSTCELVYYKYAKSKIIADDNSNVPCF